MFNLWIPIQELKKIEKSLTKKALAIYIPNCQKGSFYFLIFLNMSDNLSRQSAAQRSLAPFDKRARNLMSNFWEFPFFETPVLREISDQSSFVAPMDIMEDEKEFKVVADLPGFNPEKVDIEVGDNNNVVLSGTREDENKEEGRNFIRCERSSGSFYQKLDFPASADLDNMKCTAKNGVLTLTVPKKENSARKKVQVELLD